MSMTGNYLRSSGCRFRVGLIDTRQTGERFSAWRSFRAYPAGLKQLVVWAHACAVGGLDRYPGGEELKLWKDPDDTSIEWGNGRRKAAALPVHLERGRQLKSEAIVGEKPHLIDVADMLAYSTSHAFCEVERPDRPSFGRAFDAFLPDMAKMHWHPHAFDGAQEDQQAVDDWLRRGRDLQLPLATLTK